MTHPFLRLRAGRRFFCPCLAKKRNPVSRAALVFSRNPKVPLPSFFTHRSR